MKETSQMNFLNHLTKSDTKKKRNKKRNSKYKFKFLNISNATKAHCMQEFEGALRTDVLYKTIIRDLRKYYSKDFNFVT